MPLHLLGKKSWNVYNKDNVERVRRDEANAKAAEEAEEQRMQEVDARRRLAILRGATPPPIEQEDEAAAALPGPEPSSGSKQPRGLGAGRRPRKRQGEDDTDFELRIAREREDTVGRAAAEARRATSSAPIVDGRGHINLFGEDDKRRAHAEPNDEAKRDVDRTKRQYEDQYTMRFSNAAGNQSGRESPWYSATPADEQTTTTTVMKNVWGRDDPRRKARDEKRIATSDPLAMMKRGAAQVRALKQERGKVEDERARELRQMKRDEADERRRRRERHRSSRHRSRSPRSGDGGARRREDDDERARYRDRSREGSRDERQRRRHRSRSRERERHGGRDDEKRHK